MRVLIIHHLEQCWQQGYRKAGTSFDRLCQNILSHIQDFNYDKIILTKFECGKDKFEDFSDWPDMVESINHVYEYGYGWELSQFDYYMSEAMPFDYVESRLADGQLVSLGDFGLIEGGNHSSVVLVENWMLELKDYDVRICGAFDGECIEDLEIALQAASVSYRHINSLIV